MASSDDGPPAGGGRCGRAWGWLAWPVIAGAAVRLVNFRAQVLAGDELHALRVALEKPLGEIVTHYDQSADHSMPITALYRLAMDAGVRLSEATMRSPMLLAGVAFLVAGGLFLRRVLGPRVAAIWAWAAALSPLLVMYSRMARSYMPMVFLALVAVTTFWSWLERPTGSRVALYAGSAALAIALHLLAAPFVLAPLVFGAALGARAPGPSWRGLATLLVATGLATAALLAPALLDLWHFAGSKAGRGELDVSTLVAVARNQAGSTSAPFQLAFWGLVVGGAVVLLRRNARLALYLLTLFGLHVVALVALAPDDYEHTVTFNRYLLVALPVLLVFLAVGLDGAMGVGRSLRVVVAPGVLLGLLATSPLARRAYRTGSFTQSNRFLSFVPDAARLGLDDLPSVYGRLGELEAGALLECPFSLYWGGSQVIFEAQALHGREVLVANPWMQDARLALRNLRTMEPEDLLASRARYLVLHEAPGAEERRAFPSVKNARRFELEWTQLQAAVRELAWKLRGDWSPPILSEEGLVVWDLDRERNR